MNRDQKIESLEWHSVVEALRTVYVDSVRSVLGEDGAVVYTDGSCLKNPGGPGGWSVILSPIKKTTGTAQDDAPCIECYGHIPASPTTTNNRAEITAVLAALAIAPSAYPLIIHSDSEYTMKVAQGIYQMKMNTDLWGLYRTLLRQRKDPPHFEWVRGHAGHDLNERADELARLGAANRAVSSRR